MLYFFKVFGGGRGPSRGVPGGPGGPKIQNFSQKTLKIQTVFENVNFFKKKIQIFSKISGFFSKFSGGVGGPPGGSRGAQGAQKLRFDIFEAPL